MSKPPVRFSILGLMIATAVCALFVASVSYSHFYFNGGYGLWMLFGLSAAFAAVFAIPFARQSKNPARRWPLLVPALCWFCYGWWEGFMSQIPDAMRVDLPIIWPLLLINSCAAPVVLLIVNVETRQTKGLNVRQILGTLLLCSVAIALLLTALALFLVSLPPTADGRGDESRLWLFIFVCLLGITYAHLLAYRIAYAFYQKNQGTTFREWLTRARSAMFPEEDPDHWMRPKRLTTGDVRWIKDANLEASGNDNKAIESGPVSHSPLVVSGFAWFAMGEYDKAIKDCTKAIRKNWRHPDKAAYFFRGRAWEAKEEYDDAIEDFTVVIRMDPTFAKAYVHRGNCWENKGEPEKAKEDFAKAEELVGGGEGRAI